MNKLVAVAALTVLVMVISPAAMAQSYSMTLKTDGGSYSGAQKLTASGTITPAPGPNTAAFVEILSPSQQPVAVASALVNSTTGAFQHTFVLGGSSKWVAGTYTLNATWGNSASGPTAAAAVTFTYSPTVPTTTTSTATTTTTTTTSTPTSSTTTTSTTTTSKTSTTTTTTTTTQTPTFTSSTSSTTATTTAGGGGVPEFPFQALAVAALTLLIVASYLVARRRGMSRTTAHLG